MKKWHPSFALFQVGPKRQTAWLKPDKSPQQAVTSVFGNLYLDLLQMLGKSSKTCSPKWWFNGDLLWYKVKHHLKQIPVILATQTMHRKQGKSFNLTINVLLVWVGKKKKGLESSAKLQGTLISPYHSQAAGYRSTCPGENNMFLSCHFSGGS